MQYITVTIPECNINLVRIAIKEDKMQNLEAPKIKKSLPKYLTLDQSIKLLNSVEGKNKERDYCILTFFLNCGLRLAELVSINVSDFSDNGTLMMFIFELAAGAVVILFTGAMYFLKRSLTRPLKMSKNVL